MANIVIPSSEADRKKIAGVIKEISNSYTRIEAERAYCNDAMSTLAEDVDIPKKYLRKMARLYHNQNISEVKGEWDDVESLYESVVG